MCGWQLDVGNSGALRLFVAIGCRPAGIDWGASEWFAIYWRPVTTAACQSTLQAARVSHSRLNSQRGQLTRACRGRSRDADGLRRRAWLRNWPPGNKIHCVDFHQSRYPRYVPALLRPYYGVEPL